MKMIIKMLAFLGVFILVLALAGTQSLAVDAPPIIYSLNVTGQTLHLKDSHLTANGDQWLEVLIGATCKAKARNAALTNIFKDDLVNVLHLYYDQHLAAKAFLRGFDYFIRGGAGGHLCPHPPQPPSVPPPGGVGADNLVVDGGAIYSVPPSITFDNEIIGDTGQGTLSHSGGSNTIKNDLTLGNTATGSGAYQLSPSGTLMVGRDEVIGGDGTGSFTQIGGTHTISHDLVLGRFSTGKGTYQLNDGSLAVGLNEVIGVLGTGHFTQSGGTSTVAQDLYLGFNNGGSGTYLLKDGRLQVQRDEIIGTLGTGIFNQSGGQHTVANTLILGSSSSGTYNLSGGQLSAGTIRIRAPRAGGAGGTFNVLNTTTTVTGNVINDGTVKTTNAVVTWNGTFTNNGVYISDPATQTFNRDLSVGRTGYLAGHTSQDLFILKGDFINQSTQNTLWDTAQAALKFATGTENSHDFYIPGQGTTGTNNFAWYTLDITGQTLHFKDGNTIANGDQWLEVLTGATYTAKAENAALTNIFNDDPVNVLNLYYDKNLAANAYLGGFDYVITGGAGGHLYGHTPLPPSVLLLGSGLLGLGALKWRRRRG